MLRRIDCWLGAFPGGLVLVMMLSHLPAELCSIHQLLLLHLYQHDG